MPGDMDDRGSAEVVQGWVVFSHWLRGRSPSSNQNRRDHSRMTLWWALLGDRLVTENDNGEVRR